MFRTIEKLHYCSIEVEQGISAACPICSKPLDEGELVMKIPLAEDINIVVCLGCGLKPDIEQQVEAIP